MRLLFVCIFSLFALFSFGKGNTNYIFKNETLKDVKYEILEDNNYTFNEIQNNKTLIFKKPYTLYPSKCSIYWVRIELENNSNYSVNYSLFPLPQIENTLYFYDLDQSKWVSKREGFEVYNRNFISGLFNLKISGKSKQVLYIKINLNKIKNSPNAIVPSFTIEEQSISNGKIETRFNVAILTIGALFLFLLYSILLYFNLKDKAYVYYQIILFGAILYVIANGKFINVFFDFKYCSYYLSPNGNLHTFSINAFMGRLSSVILLFGFVELSRLYLMTKIYQPKMDRFLKWLYSVFFLLFISTSFVSLLGFMYFDFKTLFWQNLIMTCLSLSIFITAFRALKYNKKLAQYFIIANVFPLLIILFFATYFALFPVFNITVTMIISIAMLTITLTFALALVGRFNLIKDDLNKLELETNNVKSQNEMIKIKLEMNQQELISSAIHTAQKNELLVNLKNEIDLLHKNTKTEDKDAINKLKTIIQNNLVFDSNFESFKIHFEKVHPNFFSKLLDEFPNLSQNELRLSAYLHLNLTNKEIATLLNINPDSVKKAKMRLKSKLNN